MDATPETLQEVLADCWHMLARGVSNSRHGFHHPTVASLGLDGTPKARVVVLRDADKASATLRFHTDVRSEKWKELARSANLALAFYDENERVQLRMEGTASLYARDAVARDSWIKSQAMSRVCYGIAPAPGTEIDTHGDYMLPERDDTATIGYENFGAVVMKVISIEWLFLKQARNRRALFDLHGRTAKWLVP